jgi:hypothetical protein
VRFDASIDAVAIGIALDRSVGVRWKWVWPVDPAEVVAGLARPFDDRAWNATSDHISRAMRPV